MSDIGMREEIVSHDIFTLVRTEGAGFGEIYDDGGEHVLNVPLEEMEAVEKALPTLVAMYRKGFKDGSNNGRVVVQFEMRKALGL
jgi:hypothetical protein